MKIKTFIASLFILFLIETHAQIPEKSYYFRIEGEKDYSNVLGGKFYGNTGDLFLNGSFTGKLIGNNGLIKSFKPINPPDLRSNDGFLYKYDIANNKFIEYNYNKNFANIVGSTYPGIISTNNLFATLFNIQYINQTFDNRIFLNEIQVGVNLEIFNHEYDSTLNNLNFCGIVNNGKELASLASNFNINKITENGGQVLLSRFINEEGNFFVKNLKNNTTINENFSTTTPTTHFYVFDLETNTIKNNFIGNLSFNDDLSHRGNIKFVRPYEFNGKTYTPIESYKIMNLGEEISVPTNSLLSRYTAEGDIQFTTQLPFEHTFSYETKDYIVIVETIDSNVKSINGVDVTQYSEKNRFSNVIVILDKNNGEIKKVYHYPQIITKNILTNPNDNLIYAIIERSNTDTAHILLDNQVPSQTSLYISKIDIETGLPTGGVIQLPHNINNKIPSYPRFQDLTFNDSGFWVSLSINGSYVNGKDTFIAPENSNITTLIQNYYPSWHFSSIQNQEQEPFAKLYYYDKNLYINGLSSEGSINIYDLSGKHLLSNNLNPTNLQIIGVSNLKSGVYISKLTTKQGNFISQKFIVY